MSTSTISKFSTINWIQTTSNHINIGQEAPRSPAVFNELTTLKKDEDSSFSPIETPAISPASRPRAFLVIGPNEQTKWHILFAKYQKNKFPQHLVRKVRQNKDDDIYSCLARERITGKWMTDHSIFILSNGEKHPPILSAEELSQKMPKTDENCPYARFHTLSGKEKPLNLRLALTNTGAFSCLYFNEAIYSGRWRVFYNNVVLSKTVFEDFCDFYEKKKINIVCIVDQRSLTRNLHALLPNINLKTIKKEYALPALQFSSQLDCLEQWEKTKEAIVQHGKRVANGSTAGYIISHFSSFPFQKTVYIKDLFKEYLDWSRSNPSTPKKGREQFIKDLKKLVPCQVGLNKNTETVISISSEMLCVSWLHMIGIPTQLKGICSETEPLSSLNQNVF